ncbi:CBS domain-containing protein [Aestuariivirga sp.]|uniref:CBS domain-containing protein n=1 Tax=Aestuariivirga sp. TaxID=2650926 RepID=UPI0039E5573E
MSVAHILKKKGRNVITVTPGQTLHEVAAILARHRIGAVVVSSGGGISGIISERDVVRVLAEAGSSALSRPAQDFMTAKVRTCTPHDSEQHLMALMTEHRIRHLPVMENGRLAGMVSIGDVVKLRIELIESEAEQMKTYIATAG